MAEKPLPMSRSVSISTQTQGTWIDNLQALGEFSSLAVVEMNPIRDQFWDSIRSCMKMPRGGVNGGGSMRCSFEFVCANEAIVKHIMEDLLCARNQRYNLTLPSAQWTPPLRLCTRRSHRQSVRTTQRTSVHWTASSAYIVALQLVATLPTVDQFY